MKTLLFFVLAGASALAGEARHIFDLDHVAQVVIVPSLPLLHTEQVFGSTPEAVLDALGEKNPVKINGYVRHAADESALRAAVVKRFRPPPAFTCVVTAFPESAANFAVDAVAPTARTGVGVLPAGGVAYISGQAEKGMDLREATRKTMESLGATLKFLGADWPQTVQVKAFMQPMTEATAVREEIAKFFTNGQMPPVVLVEWIGGAVPIEIELVAAAPNAAEAIEFLTPPAMKASPVFCRVVRLTGGPRIYTSGFSAQGDAAAQVKDVFEQLKAALDAAGSDLKHLAKATYYVATDDVSKALSDLRPNYYDPQRPPAASKAMVPQTGSGPSTFTMDMIAVPAR
jgi:enamine deaminase RidA (YjgF/YER057c/UK114 family)